LKRNPKRTRTFRITTAAVICAAISLTLMTVGCGPSTPEAAVQNLTKAINNGDWEGFLSSILPEKVRVMSDTEMQSQKKLFKENREEFAGLQMKVVFDKNDKNKAKVVLTAGKNTRVNPTTGQNETVNIKDYPEEGRTLNAVKFKGRWYVDITLSTEGQQPQQAPQSSQ
jgi:hypothetical protein